MVRTLICYMNGDITDELAESIQISVEKLLSDEGLSLFWEIEEEG